jgi:hypothetical protein
MVFQYNYIYSLNNAGIIYYGIGQGICSRYSFFKKDPEKITGVKR